MKTRQQILVEEWNKAGFSAAVISLALETPLLQELSKITASQVNKD